MPYIYLCGYNSQINTGFSTTEPKDYLIFLIPQGKSEFEKNEVSIGNLELCWGYFHHSKMTLLWFLSAYFKIHKFGRSFNV